MITRFLLAFWLLLQVSVAGPGNQLLLSYKAPAVGGSLTVVNAWKNGGNGGSTLTITISPTAGNLLVCGFSEWQSTADNSAMSDDVGGTTGWTKVVRSVSGNVSVVIWYKANVPSGITTLTYTRSTGATYYDGIVHEISGASTSSPFTSGESAANGGTATTNPTTGTATIATANSILFAVISNYDPNNPATFTVNGTGSTPSSGWAYYSSNSSQLNGAGNQPIGVPYVVVSTTGGKAHGWTTGSYQYAAAIAAFH